MTFDTLDLDVTADGVATVRLVRPPVNAIDGTMRADLAEALSILREDRVQVAVFCGTEEVFSVGADISLFEEARDWTTQAFRENSRTLGRTFDGLEDLEKPVIAAIEDTCVGGGLELALACDVRIAAPDATFGFPENNIGLIPGLGGCSRLVHLVGPGTAKDLIFRGTLIDGEAARDLGLVQHVETDPEAAAAEYAAELLAKPPQAIGVAKRVVDAARNADLETAGLLESLAQSTLLETDDHAEGVAAFREKRDPEFTGR